MPVTRSDLPLTTAHLAYLLDTCGDGFIVCDALQSIVLINQEAERIFGWEDGALLGETVERLMPERFRKAHSEGFAKRAQDPAGMPIRYVELVGQRKDGSEFPVEVRFTYTPLGGDIYFTGSVRDISEQVAARNELERRAKEIERLNRALKRERDYLREEVAETRAGTIIGSSPALARALQVIVPCAESRHAQGDPRLTKGVDPAVHSEVEGVTQGLIAIGVPLPVRGHEALEKCKKGKGTK